MFNKYKRIIEKIVDIKRYLNLIFLNSLVILFPLNQQYHFRPFPSVDGFIIDYLILKISIIEVILILIFIFNFYKILEAAKLILRSTFFWILIVFISIAVFRSNYLVLALYENSILIIYFLIGNYIFHNLGDLNVNLLRNSLKFWVIVLSLLGYVQFYTQGSVLNNYYLFGEFPYSSEHYHVKQKSIIFDNFIPPYAIFSHSNIFGAYLIFMLFFLRVLKSDSRIFYLLVFTCLLIIGSTACLLAFFILIASRHLAFDQIKNLIFYFLILCLGVLFLNSYKYSSYLGDFSIYRRLYMFDLSLTYFINNPLMLLFGSGYYNYFLEIKENLFSYEIVRFFQPQHFGFFFLIWQYGLLFLLIISVLVTKYLPKSTADFLRVLLLVVVLSCFDHYIFTNHQFKVLLLLVIPYSLKIKNSI